MLCNVTIVVCYESVKMHDSGTDSLLMVAPIVTCHHQ